MFKLWWYSFLKVVYSRTPLFIKNARAIPVPYSPLTPYFSDKRPKADTHSHSHLQHALTTETVEGTALALEGVDDVKRRDGLALGVLGVGDGVTDDTLEEGLEDTTGLLVDHGRDTLDTTTTCETADGGLCDTLDVVTKNLAVTLGTTLAEALAALAACVNVSMLLLCV